jgi:hypothetical protein
VLPSDTGNLLVSETTEPLLFTENAVLDIDTVLATLTLIVEPTPVTKKMYWILILYSVMKEIPTGENVERFKSCVFLDR